MADVALNVDWRATALLGCGAQTPPMMTAATDWLPQVITDPATRGGRLNVDQSDLIVRTWDGQLTYYKMRGMDNLTNGLYATWVVSGTPDFGAARYIGPILTPLRDVCIIDVWNA